MSKNVKSKFKAMLPYFLLAVAVLITHRIIASLSAFSGAASAIRAILAPFFYGFLLAFIVNVPYSGIKGLLQKSRVKFFRKQKKIFAALLTIAFFSLLVFLITRLLVPHIQSIVAYFVVNLPVYLDMTLRSIERFNEMDLFGIYISLERIMAMIQGAVSDISFETLAVPLNFIFGVPAALFTAALAFISSIYIMIEKGKFKKFLCRALCAFAPEKAAVAIIEFAGRLNKNFKRYVYIQSIDGLILGAIATLILLILRSPYALILGVMLGLLNYVPYFGSIVGTIVAIIVVAFTQGIGMAAIAAAVLLVAQQIDGNIIQPKLMGGSFSLSPLLIIISVTIGGAAAGVLGMIAAIPIVAALKEIAERALKCREAKKTLRANEEDGASGL
ncbi:MAG: AI-2E family transporter [Treponema sp.]|nr:AI-2E family transporter [Treponema sp.]